MRRANFDPKDRKCLICGSDELRKFKAKAADAETPSLINIVECSSCNFAWQYPLVRTESQSVQWFESAYADGGRTNSKYFDVSRKRQIAKLELDFAATLPVKNKNILDIGAGAGVFAEIAAENDWIVTAVDPAIDSTKFESSRVSAIKGTIAQIPADKFFDIVTLWDVIEHVANPIELIHDAAKFLKEGGWLVLETGNYSSVARLLAGTSHWMYQLDHRWYFSPESLGRLLTETGFSKQIFCDRVLRPNWSGIASYAGPSRLHLLKEIARQPWRLAAHVSKHHALNEAREWQMPGMEIFAIAARKVERPD